MQGSPGPFAWLNLRQAIPCFRPDLPDGTVVLNTMSPSPQSVGSFSTLFSILGMYFSYPAGRSVQVSMSKFTCSTAQKTFTYILYLPILQGHGHRDSLSHQNDESSIRFKGSSNQPYLLQVRVRHLWSLLLLAYDFYVFLNPFASLGKCTSNRMVTYKRLNSVGGVVQTIGSNFQFSLLTNECQSSIQGQVQVSTTYVMSQDVGKEWLVFDTLFMKTKLPSPQHCEKIVASGLANNAHLLGFRPQVLLKDYLRLPKSRILINVIIFMAYVVCTHEFRTLKWMENTEQ